MCHLCVAFVSKLWIKIAILLKKYERLKDAKSKTDNRVLYRVNQNTTL